MSRAANMLESLVRRPWLVRFYAASMCGFVLSSRWVGVGSHGGFTACRYPKRCSNQMYHSENTCARDREAQRP